MKILAAIPVRMESERFHGKPLAMIGGRHILDIVMENVGKASEISEIIVATDSDEIFRFCEWRGLRAIPTSKNACCGSERIAEIAQNSDADIFINIQGDEPMIQGWMIDRLIERMTEEGADMATIVGPMTDENEYNDPNTVKAVLNAQGYALYFSRSPIPYRRRNTTSIFKHIGIYAYTKKALEIYSSQQVSPLEYAESLEQLRALEHGVGILCVNMVEAANIVSVNSPDDIARLEGLLGNS